MAKRATAGGRGLSRMSFAELQAELGRRQRRVRALVKRRDRLAAKLDGIEGQIRDLGGTVGGGGTRGMGVRKRPKNAMNLVDALSQVLSGKTMSVTDAAEAVQKAGYKTTSSTFRTIVNQTLINSGAFKKVARGQYTAK